MPNTTSIATTLTQLFDAPAQWHKLRGILRGLEKESLRATPDDHLAQTPHPAMLGAALTHPQITTDYSEALLEFITQPHPRIKHLLAELDEIHRFTYSGLSSSRERLWPSSMPCLLGEDDQIPVARYGVSHSGMMKTIYRMGLGHRYGRAMQTIAGIHYNVSFSDELWQHLYQSNQSSLNFTDFKTEQYFAMIRNFRRFFPLLIYLFGASPAISNNFVKDRSHQLDAHPHAPDTLYLPYATSLRMGDLGYQSDAQKQLVIDYNNLDDYVNTLYCAITKTHPAYATIGKTDAQGEYRQLNTSLLQIENEFYSSIRPKRAAQRGETALTALRDRGVEYVEVRCLDLNPYEPLGITAPQLRFVDAFLLYCLLSPSARSDAQESQEILENQRLVVNFGRDPELLLSFKGQPIKFIDWATHLINEISQCSQALDRAYDRDLAAEDSFTTSANIQLAKVNDKSLTPSAAVAKSLNEGQSFIQVTSALASQHAHFFASRPLNETDLAIFEARTQKSLEDQSQLEENQQESLEQYLDNYYLQYKKAARKA